MHIAFEYLVQKEPLFQEIVKRYGLPPIPRRSPGFETLVLLILEQQVSVDAARATFEKIKTQIPCTPENLLPLSPESYRALGVSRQKTSYIKNLAQAIVQKELDLDQLSLKSSGQVREELIRIKGIGNWTIDIYLMFCLEEADFFPLGDIALVNTMKELFHIQERKEMEQHCKAWSPYRSYACYLLWHYYLKKRNRSIVY